MASQAVLELLISLKDEASSALSGLSGNLSLIGGLAGGAVVAGLGAAGMAAFDFASQANQGVNDLQASLGLTRDQAEELGGIAQAVFADNWGNSLSEVSETLGTVKQRLGNLYEDELADATTDAIALRDTFGVEMPESVDAAKTLMDNFGLTSEQAFDFIAKGFQSGLDRSGDFLDTIGEYSTQFSNGGADAGQFFSLLQSGMQGGVLGTDKAADAFKEFRVRIQDGSSLTSDSLKAIGIDANTLAQQMASGQVTAADAFQLVVDKLGTVDDANLRMQAGVGLLGTQFEDLGTAGALALSLTGTSLTDMAGATDTLNAKYNNLGAVWEGVNRQALVAIAPVGDALLGLANEAMPAVTAAFGWLQEQLPPIIDAAVGLIGQFRQGGVDLGNQLTPMIASLGAMWQEVLLPAIQEVAAFVMSDIVPILQDLATALLPLVSAAVQLLAGIWVNVLAPALSAVWGFLKANVVPILAEVAAWLAENLPPAIAKATDFFTNQILPAVRAVHQFLGTQLIPIVQDVITWLGNVAKQAQDLATTFSDNLQRGIQVIVDLFGGPLQSAISGAQGVLTGLSGWLGDIETAASGAATWIGNALDALSKAADAAIPDWLEGRSPPPLANWLNWIAEGAEAASAALPEVGKAMPRATAGGLATSGGGGGGVTVNLYVNDRALRDLVRVEVAQANATTATAAGARGRS